MHDAETTRRDRANLGRNLGALKEAAVVVSALAEHGVDVVVMKGAVLLELGLVSMSRPMADVDLLVRQRDGERAVDIVRACGLFKVPRPRRQTTAALVDGEFCSPAGTQIDLHTTVSLHGRWPVDYNAIFDDAESFVLAGVTARRPCAEDMLLIAGINLAKDDFVIDARRAADIAAMIEGFEIDWSRLVRRAREWRAATSLWLALEHAVHREGARVPASVLSMLRPPAVRAAYLRVMLELGRAPAYRFGGHGRRTRQALLGMAIADAPVTYLVAAGRFSVRRTRDWLLARRG